MGWVYTVVIQLINTKEKKMANFITLRKELYQLSTSELEQIFIKNEDEKRCHIAIKVLRSRLTEDQVDDLVFDGKVSGE